MKETRDLVESQKEKIAIQSEINRKLKSEVEESKSPDTAIALYQKKYRDGRK